MGQKVDPRIIRLGIAGNQADAKWCVSSKSAYASYLNDDIKIRKFLKSKLSKAGISHIHIERPAEHVFIASVHCVRPGMVIGRSGSDVSDLKRAISQRYGVKAHINIVEVKKPELISVLVGENIAAQLEKRVAFRKAMKRAVQSAMRAGAQGIKVCVSGRLAGAEIARSEGYKEGRVPLHTFRADIDYATASAHTTYGVIGIKVWIYKGDKFVKKVSHQG